MDLATQYITENDLVLIIPSVPLGTRTWGIQFVLCWGMSQDFVLAGQVLYQPKHVPFEWLTVAGSGAQGYPQFLI